MRQLHSFRAGEVARRLQSSISPVTVVSCFDWFVRMAHVAARIFSAEIVRLFSFFAPNGLMPTFPFHPHHTDSARFLPSQIPAGFISSAGVSLPPRLRGGLFLNIHQMPPNLSPEPTAVGAGSWRSQRCHELVAPYNLFAARTVIAVAVHAASRRWLSFFR